jgi:hypothetical protein
MTHGLLVLCGPTEWSLTDVSVRRIGEAQAGIADPTRARDEATRAAAAVFRKILITSSFSLPS